MILPPRRASVETHDEDQRSERERKKVLSFDEVRMRLERLKALGQSSSPPRFP